MLGDGHRFMGVYRSNGCLFWDGVAYGSCIPWFGTPWHPTSCNDAPLPYVGTVITTLHNPAVSGQVSILRKHLVSPSITFEV